LVYEALRKILSSISDKYTYEIIFINDGSIDTTWQEILEITVNDKKVKGINLSRNF
jgi:glycosyltransferase involved in cell wall biosynthesis